jgi:hypothetical protein
MADQERKKHKAEQEEGYLAALAASHVPGFAEVEIIHARRARYGVVR